MEINDEFERKMSDRHQRMKSDYWDSDDCDDDDDSDENNNDEYNEDEEDFDNDSDFDDSEEEIVLTEEQKEEMHRRKYVGRLYNGELHPEYFMPRPNRLSNEVLYQHYKEEAKELKREITNDEEFTKADEELEKIIYRFDMKMNRGPIVLCGDANTLPYPLPHDVTPLDMRSWICTWEPFDFVVVPWPCIETEPEDLGDPHENFAKTLRPWLEEWIPFDFDISPPKDMAKDLIERDVLTKRQERVLKLREEIRQKDDAKSMKQRQAELGTYFQEKYHKSAEEMQKYSNFVSSHKKSKLALESLCKSAVQ